MTGEGVELLSRSQRDEGSPLAPARSAPPAPREPVLTARIWIALLGFVAGAVLVGLVTLSPDPVDSNHRALVRELLAFLHAHGVPQRFDYSALEFSANIAMFVPLGFFAALLLPFGSAWIAGIVGVAFSISVEAAQFVLLPARFATVLDVLANSLGAWLGVCVAVLLRVCVAARDKRLLRAADARRSIVTVSRPDSE